jgi:hypothetical protein
MVVHPALAAATSAVPPPAPSSAALAARACRARPDLHPAHPLARAAVLLLTAPSARFNIDLMERRTGYPRNFVAACARRLYDNGVWKDGRAEYAAGEPEDPRFWSDAAVALGELCRRDGACGPEWAAPGEWNKPYEYVSAAPGAGLAISYRDAAPEPVDYGAAPAAEPSAAAEVEVALALATLADAAPEPPAPRPRFVVPEPEPAGPALRHVVWLGPAPRIAAAGVLGGEPGEPELVGAASGGHELFPGAAWLT